MHIVDLGTVHQRFLIVLSPGDEVIASLERFVDEHNVQSASVNAIGALSRARLGFFDLSSRSYREISVDEQVEALSILGNAARFEGRPRLHLHAVLSYPDGSCVGGHLIEAHVDPTLEVILDVTSTTVDRETDARTGLQLIAPPTNR